MRRFNLDPKNRQHVAQFAREKLAIERAEKARSR